MSWYSITSDLSVPYRRYVLAGTYGTYGTYGRYLGYLRYGRYLVPTRERNLLALPTLDMYLPLSKFESIH